MQIKLRIHTLSFTTDYWHTEQRMMREAESGSMLGAHSAHQECTVCSEKIALDLDHPNEMPTIRIFSPLFSDPLTSYNFVFPLLTNPLFLLGRDIFQM